MKIIKMVIFELQPWEKEIEIIKKGYSNDYNRSVKLRRNSETLVMFEECVIFQ